MNCDPNTIANASACLLESLSAGGNAGAQTFLLAQTAAAPWILAGGIWNDNGGWIDTAVWID